MHVSIAPSTKAELTTNPTISNRWLLAVIRVVWVILAGIGILQVFIYFSLLYDQYSAPSPDLARYGIAPGVFVGYFTVLTILSLFVFYGVSALLMWRKPQDRISTLVAIFLIALGTSPVDSYGPISLSTFLIGHPLAWLTSPVLGTVAWGGFLLFPVFFPDGHIVPRWARYLIVYYLIITIVSNYIVPDSPFFPYNWPPLLMLFVISSVLGSAFYIQVYRYRHVSSPSQRQQTKWIVFGFVLTGIILFPAGLLSLPTLSSTSRILVDIFRGFAGFSLVLIPITIASAILRYRLWDIDIIINRTLVYGVLSGVIIGIYVLVVGALSILFQSSGNLVISLVGTGIVALSIQPLRERLQRGINRLMYGARDEPYSVLERLAERLDLVVNTNQILPTIVETVAQALKLPYAAITLRHGDDFKIATTHFRSSDGTYVNDDSEILSLIYQSDVVGQLILAPRGPRETFSETERHLLETIARQASIAAYNVRLTDELKSSREQLVTAREEERRRLRRDLHDDLGPILATVSVGLDAIHNLADNPDTTRELAMLVKSQTQAALEDIRRIAYDLRPPALDEFGLIGALKQHIEAGNHVAGLHITFDEPGALPQLPAAVEVAAYRIALEAITNVQRHAQAQECSVHLTMADHELFLEISDDGCGLTKSNHSGVGLQAIRERTAELGGSCSIQTRAEGGTIVAVRLPLPQYHEN